MKKPNRIGLSLFDEELLALINASAKIFPITQEDIDNNINNMSYEYARVGNHIYRWTNNTEWQYIVADDADIEWSDIKNKPVAYVPKEHTHSELHSHSNKSIIDSITQLMLNTWNTVTGKADKTYVDTELNNKASVNHTHPYALDTHNHDTSYYKKTEVDSKLLTKSDGTHNHDGAYYKKSEVDTKLIGKSDTNHVHNYSLDTHNHNELYAVKSTEGLVSDIEGRLQDIEGGYSEGHWHNNLTTLESITPTSLVNWNLAHNHISDSVKHTTPEERLLWNTVSGKANVSHRHDKSDINDLSLDWSSVEGKPTTFPATPHTHDDRYYTETEIDIKLSSKADGTTVSGHTSNGTIHVTSGDKTTWNGKANVSQVPTKLSQLEADVELGGNFATIGTVKPTDGSMWYEEI